MYSDLFLSHEEPDPEDDPDFADMQMLYNDSIGSTMAHYAELQHAMRPWEKPRPTEAPYKVDVESRKRR